jgi:tRNA-dihydrouridine synthase
MDDVTDVVFREIMSTQVDKPDVLVTEFTNTDALNTRGRAMAIRKFKYTENQRPIVAQIWGLNPDHYFSAAQLVQEMGFDGVDINMGCPVKDVVKRGAGAAHCTNPALAAEIIDAVKRGAPNIPLSVKTRIGYKTVVTEEWVGFLLKQDLHALTLHGRTALQMSDVPADWNEIGKAVKLRNQLAPETILMGNGDITSYGQTVQLQQQYGFDGVMIGRGVFSNPWVFEKTMIPTPHSKQEYLGVLLKHVELFHQTWGDAKNFHLLKKFFKMYVRDFDNASELRQQLMECNTSAEIVEIIQSQF